MGKRMSMIYGIAAYAVFLGTALYAIGFIGGFGVPKDIDSGQPGGFGLSLAINAALLGLFTVQHTGMARQAFKRWLTRHVPSAIERSTYVLVSSALLIMMYWLWQPIPQVVWNVENTVARGVIMAMFAAGWLIFLAASFQIHHFDLFGLRQVWMNMKGERYRDLGFRVNGLYKYVRHPIQVGFLIAFWATPTMTVGHLVFSIATTAYIVVAVLFFEEIDLVKHFGNRYRRYQQQVYAFMPIGRYRKPRLSEIQNDETATDLRVAA